jgi:hypothetical protein
MAGDGHEAKQRPVADDCGGEEKDPRGDAVGGKLQQRAQKIADGEAL